MTNNRLTGALILILSMLISPNLKAQNEVLNLSDAIQTALVNSPQVKQALLAVKDADQLVRIAYGEVFPEITSSINYTRNLEPSVFFITSQDQTTGQTTVNRLQIGSDNSWQGGFTVTQNIFKGEALVGISSATVFRLVQNENLRATNQQIATNVRISYYAVLAAKERLRLQKAQINRLEKNLKENEARATAGIIDSYDVLRLKVQLDNQRPQLIEAEYALKESYRNLGVAMGFPSDYSFEIEGDLKTFDILSAQDPVNSDLKKVDQMNAYTFGSLTLNEDELANTRGDLRVIEASIGLKSKEILAIKSRFLPSLAATYNLQWSAAETGAPTFFENNIRFQTLGLTLNLPIFQGFERMANVERAQIQRKDLEEQKRAVELVAQNEVLSAAEDLNRYFETSDILKRALVQAKQGYDRAVKRFENGLGTQLDVTEADVQVRQAELNYALMVFNYLSSKAQYDLAMGIVPLVDTNQ